MTRLVPPWQPMTVIAETDSIADGRAVLGLPGGLRWVAQHDPAGFEPPERFLDVLSSSGPSSWPPRAIGRWRHEHEFIDTGDGTTVVRDRVSTPVPAAALRSTFVYRHAQLAADLAAHREAARVRATPLVVAITGASGVVGSALSAFLTTGGHRVIRLVRRPAEGKDERQWDTGAPAPDLLSGVDAVVHLAGASIAGRFSDDHKAAIRDSRIGPTRRLAEAAGRSW
jgi:ligand-binding SRPBCC domain-containing protein